MVEIKYQPMNYVKNLNTDFIKQGAERVFTVPQLYLGQPPKTKFWDIKESVIATLLNVPHTREQIVSICFPIIAESWNPMQYMDLSDEDKMELIRTQFKEKRFLTLLENFIVSVKIDGVPRSITHQIVRHRRLNFSQESFRVCDIRHHDFTIYDQIDKDPSLRAMYQGAALACKVAYCKLVDAGIPPEFAREIMPMGTLTSIIISGNIGDFVQYLNMRTGGEVMDTHRTVVSTIKRLLEHSEPALWEMIKYIVKDDETH